MACEHGVLMHPSARSRRLVRYLTAALSAVVGILYLVLLVLVFEAESRPGATDSNTYGGYLFLAVAYLLGAALLLTTDRLVLWAVGAIVQVLVIVLFVLFGVGVFGPGVFEYQALSDLRMALWATVITSAQVILLGLLSYLALTLRRLGNVPEPPAAPQG